jgi:hypothetical protein
VVGLQTFTTVLGYEKLFYGRSDIILETTSVL